MTGGPSAEIHLFLIWEHGRPQESRILADVGASFAILEVWEIEWARDRFARNLTRFYGQSLPPGSDKERHCGTGPSLLIVVEDQAPRYGRRELWGRPVTVNTRMFDAKRRYREWTGGGHRVHSTTVASETDHDLFVLLGRRAADYAGGDKPPWDGSVRRWPHEPVGSSGWATREELLTAVEVTLAYAVLAESESSIRLLVEGAWDHWGVEWLVAEPDPARPRGPLHSVLVAGRPVVLELRHVGDGTAPEPWQRAILRDRVRDATGAWTAPPEDAAWLDVHEALTRGRVPGGFADGATARVALERHLAGRDLPAPEQTRRPLLHRLGGVARRLRRA